MIKRLVTLNDIKVLDVVYGSSFIIGDSWRATPFSRILAVQKEGAWFEEGTYKYENHPIFTRQFKRLPPTGIVNDSHYHHDPTINVGSVRVIGVSTSAMIQVGSLDIFEAESRVKHIRILREEEQQEEFSID